MLNACEVVDSLSARKAHGDGNRAREHGRFKQAAVRPGDVDVRFRAGESANVEGDARATEEVGGLTEGAHDGCHDVAAKMSILDAEEGGEHELDDIVLACERLLQFALQAFAQEVCITDDVVEFELILNAFGDVAVGYLVSCLCLVANDEIDFTYIVLAAFQCGGAGRVKGAQIADGVIEGA